MAADTDPDIDAQIRAVIGAAKPTQPQTAHADTDPDIEAQVRAQLASPVPPANVPAAQPVAPSLPGSYVSAAPEKGWLGKLDDMVRMTAGGIPFADRISAGLNTAMGTGLPNADYAKNLQDERWKDDALRQQYPTLSKVLPFAGAAAATVATAPEEVIAAPTILGKIVGGAATGTVYGAAQGASDAPDLSNPADAAKHIATGAATGLAMGAGTPLVGGLIGSTYGAAANAVNGGAQGISRPAASQLLRSLAAQGVDPTQEALDRLGPEAMLADTGAAMRAKTQGAAIYNPEGRVIVPDALDARDARTNGRLAQDVVSSLGPTPQTPLQIDATIKQLRSYEHSALPEIFANAGPVDATTPLVTIGHGLTTAVGPEAAVLGKARDWLMDTRLNQEGNPVRTPVTDPQKLQNIKSSIDTLIDRGDASLGVPAGAVSKAQGAIGLVRSQLNQALREQVPGYGEVMDRSSALARKADAIETGYNDLLGGGKSALHPADLNDRLQAAAKKGPEVLEGYRIGLRAAIDRTMGTNANDLVALRRQLGDEGDWNRANLNSVLGAGPVGKLAESIDRNSAFRDTKNKIMEGAKTAWATQALNELKPNAGTDRVPFITPQSNLAGMVATAAAYPFKKAYQVMGDQLRADPYASHGELARVLTAQGKQRDTYMSALVDALQRRNRNAAIGQSIGNKSALAAALIGGRALNDQLQPR